MIKIYVKSLMEQEVLQIHLEMLKIYTQMIFNYIKRRALIAQVELKLLKLIEQQVKEKSTQQLKREPTI